VNRAAAIQALGGLALAPAPARAGGGVPVFMLHHVNDTRPASPIALGLTFPTEHFEELLRYLAAHRIATMTAGELVDTIRRGHLSLPGAHPAVVVLTFDDGYADAATVVFPLLRRYGMRATFFVNDGTLGLRGHMSYRDLRTLHAAGCEIGAHGMHHLDLTTLSREEQLHEAGDCVARIARYTGIRPVSYAYASGSYNATTLSVMREIGMQSAWTEIVGPVRDLRHPYQMPRLRIARDTSTSQFAAMAAT